MQQDQGASPSGDQATAVEPVPVSPLRDGILSAWPLCGYAPGNYCGRCRDCGVEWWDGDKRASQCLECASRSAKKLIEEGRRLKQVTHLFREFVIRNATQWQSGTNHHHPIWSMLAELLPGDDIRSGPDWRFILPGNQLSWEECHAQGIEAGTDETAQQAQPEGQEPDPAGDAPTPGIAHPNTPGEEK